MFCYFCLAECLYTKKREKKGAWSFFETDFSLKQMYTLALTYKPLFVDCPTDADVRDSHQAHLRADSGPGQLHERRQQDAGSGRRL